MERGESLCHHSVAPLSSEGGETKLDPEPGTPPSPRPLQEAWRIFEGVPTPRSTPSGPPGAAAARRDRPAETAADAVTSWAGLPGNTHRIRKLADREITGIPVVIFFIDYDGDGNTFHTGPTPRLWAGGRSVPRQSSSVALKISFATYTGGAAPNGKSHGVPVAIVKIIKCTRPKI